MTLECQEQHEIAHTRLFAPSPAFPDFADLRKVADLATVVCFLIAGPLNLPDQERKNCTRVSLVQSLVDLLKSQVLPQNFLVCCQLSSSPNNWKDQQNQELEKPSFLTTLLGVTRQRGGLMFRPGLSGNSFSEATESFWSI